MSQMMIQKHRYETRHAFGRAAAFECAICRREPGNGTAITATDMGVMLCDQHNTAG